MLSEDSVSSCESANTQDPFEVPAVVIFAHLVFGFPMSHSCSCQSAQEHKHVDVQHLIKEKRLTVSLDQDLHREFKKLSIALDVTMKDLIIADIKKWLAEAKTA